MSSTAYTIYASSKRRTTNNIDYSRSYATEENLAAALKKYGIADDRHLVVCNREGRFTAIFPVSNIRDGNLTRYAHRGFMTLG